MLFPEKTCKQLIQDGSLTPEMVEGKIFQKIEDQIKLLGDDVDLAGLVKKIQSYEAIPEDLECWACAAWNIHMFIVEDTAEIQQLSTENELEFFMDGLYGVFKEIWLGVEHPPFSQIKIVFDRICGQISVREALMLQKFLWLR